MHYRRTEGGTDGRTVGWTKPLSKLLCATKTNFSYKDGLKRKEKKYEKKI